MDDDGAEHPHGWVLVEDAAIVAVGGDSEPADPEARRIDLGGAVVTPGEILSNAQAGDYPEAQARDTMKVHVRRIRTKLAALLPDAEMILNLRGIGYLFEKPDDGTMLTRRRRALGQKPRVANG